jgi:alginate O-acetyltransferase complex protein AlgI
MISIVVDFYCGKKIFEESHERRRKYYLLVSIFVNLGLLGFFKYFNFFIDNLNIVFGGSLNNLDLILPIGISFYTFQTMSYTIDIYNKKIKPETSFMNFAIYVSFFPQLIAGPIVRARQFLPQLKNDIELKKENLEEGVQIFIYGLVKKLIIADRLGYYVDSVLENYTYYGWWTIGLAIISFSIQLYCDFSGYSDMAIGLGKMLGFKIPVNFRVPITAVNIADFWSRWHITLSRWLRDYVYIPLCKKTKLKMNHLMLLITIVLCGLWHGASWNYVLWGTYLGVWQVIHMIVRKRTKFRLPAFWAWFGTYILLNIAGAIFRITDLNMLIDVFRRILTLESGLAWIYPPIVPILLVFGIGTWIRKKYNNEYPIVNLNTFGGAFAIVFAIFAIFFWSSTMLNPFIYFQF